MNRVLKNMLRQDIGTIFRGRTIMFRSKESKTFNTDDEEQMAEYRHWTGIYGTIMRDITDLLKVGEKI